MNIYGIILGCTKPRAIITQFFFTNILFSYKQIFFFHVKKPFCILFEMYFILLYHNPQSEYDGMPFLKQICFQLPVNYGLCFFCIFTSERTLSLLAHRYHVA